MTQAEVIEKVKKLLALARNAGASEGERDNAMRMATRLLARFNLDISDVSAVVEERERRLIEGAPETFRWSRYVYAGLSDLFYCFYYQQERQSIHAVIGKAVNVMTAHLMAEYVIENISREAADRAGRAKLDAILGLENASNGRGKAWEGDFCLGAAISVQAKCKELRKREEELNKADNLLTGKNALTLLGFWEQENAKNKALLANMGISLSVGKGDTTKNASAMEAGRAHGKNISLSKQVGSGPQVLRLGSK